MLLNTTGQGASAPTTTGESRMEERKEIAPKPQKKNSQTHVIYDALDALGGRATKKQLFAQTKLIWHKYRNDRPPRTVSELNRILLSTVSQGYLQRLTEKKGVDLNCEYTFASYEHFADKQCKTMSSRAVYTLAKVENGEQVITETTRIKLEKTIDTPEFFLPPPRILGESLDTIEDSEPKDQKADQLPPAAKPQPEPDAPKNMEELLAAAEKIIARQQPSPHNHPVAKIEVPVVSAIIGIGVAGLVLGAVICLGIIALSW